MADRTCSIEGCDSPVAGRGWCNAHWLRWQRFGDPLAVLLGPWWPEICRVDGCDKPTRSRGWCHTHYSRWKRTGDASPAVPVVPHVPSVGECAVEGCDRCPVNRGLCHAHYERLRLTGDLSADIPIRSRINRIPPGTPCAVEGCEKSAKGGARGWCAMHYTRWKEHGDLLYVPPQAPAICSVEGCRKPARTRGLCEAHYSRLSRYGDPEWQRPVKLNSEVNYFAFHTRLRKARGSAAEHPCVTCGRPAREWAYIHGEDPCAFDSYVPMCCSCHRKYDCTPEKREKMRRIAQVRWGRSDSSYGEEAS